MVSKWAQFMSISEELALETRNKLIEITARAIAEGKLTMIQATIMKEAYDQGLGIDQDRAWKSLQDSIRKSHKDLEEKAKEAKQQ